MIKHITIPLAFLMTIGTQAETADPDHVQSLKDQNACLRCDLKGARLEYANLKKCFSSKPIYMPFTVILIVFTKKFHVLVN